VDWVIDYKDTANQIDYSFDFKSLERQATVDGKTGPKERKPLPPAAASGQSSAIQIEIGPERIVIEDAQGNELDNYTRPNPAAPLGRFGFKGEAALRMISASGSNLGATAIAPNRPDLVEVEVSRFCSSFQPLLRKYPFNLSSSIDLPLRDFTDYFAPGQGAIWEFQSASLAELTILDGGVWKRNPASQQLKASQALLDFLNKAQQITKAFFPDGGVDPHLSYTLRQDLADPGQVIKLQIDGQAHEFGASAGILQHTFRWPAVPAQQGAVAQSGTSKFSATFSAQAGVWSVFRMFGDAEPRELLQKTLVWKRTKGASGVSGPMDPPVTLELVGFPGNVDIFNPKFFADLKCPSKTAQ
jgi:hypothetical protein